MNGTKETINFKVILLGDSSVGKSSMLLRYTNDMFFDNNTSTLGNILKLKKELISRKKK